MRCSRSVHAEVEAARDRIGSGKSASVADTCHDTVGSRPILPVRVREWPGYASKCSRFPVGFCPGHCGCGGRQPFTIPRPGRALRLGIFLILKLALLVPASALRISRSNSPRTVGRIYRDGVGRDSHPRVAPGDHGSAAPLWRSRPAIRDRNGSAWTIPGAVFLPKAGGRHYQQLVAWVVPLRAGNFPVFRLDRL